MLILSQPVWCLCSHKWKLKTKTLPRFLYKNLLCVLACCCPLSTRWTMPYRVRAKQTQGLGLCSLSMAKGECVCWIFTGLCYSPNYLVFMGSIGFFISSKYTFKCSSEFSVRCYMLLLQMNKRWLTLMKEIWATQVDQNFCFYHLMCLTLTNRSDGGADVGWLCTKALFGDILPFLSL